MPRESARCLGFFFANGEQPYRGWLIFSTLRAYISPITANCSRLCALQSTFAPTSSSTHGFPVELGIGVASAGLSTPGSVPSTILAVAMAAPVLPAVTNPATFAFAHQLQPTRIELSFLVRTACTAFSSIPMRSEAWWMTMADPRFPGARPEGRAAPPRVQSSGPAQAKPGRRESPPYFCLWCLVGTYRVKRMSMSMSESLLRSFLHVQYRPALVRPHFGQAWWGSFFSWQLGHSESPTAVRKS